MNPPSTDFRTAVSASTAGIALLLTGTVWNFAASAWNYRPERGGSSSLKLISQRTTIFSVSGAQSCFFETISLNYYCGSFDVYFVCLMLRHHPLYGTELVLFVWVLSDDGDVMCVRRCVDGEVARGHCECCRRARWSHSDAFFDRCSHCCFCWWSSPYTSFLVRSAVLMMSPTRSVLRVTSHERSSALLLFEWEWWRVAESATLFLQLFVSHEKIPHSSYPANTPEQQHIALRCCLTWSTVPSLKLPFL